jgi:hypothetical protein
VVIVTDCIGRSETNYNTSGRGSDREDPTDGVTGDICPAGRYCSKYTNNHNIGNELIMVNLP